MADSRLADIYRKELKTKGLLGALVSASGARLKEKTDIRGMLPQTGVSGAAFEKMFGKRYKYGGDKQTVRSAGGSVSGVSKSMEEKLTRIGVDGRLTAKNTVVLPAMARDMNLMRMNMQKMVKLFGGTPSTKSDMFFKRASDREAQYEGQFKRTSGGLTPTPVGGKKEEGGGFFDTILGFFKGGLGNIVQTLIGALIKGGLIAGFLVALGKYFRDDDFRQAVNNMLDGLFKTVFGDDYKKNLATGAAILAGAYVAFKASLALLEAAIFAASRRIGMLGGPGLPGGPDGPDKGKGKGSPKRGGWMRGLGTAVGIGVIGKGIQYYLEQNESEEDARRLAQEDIDNQAKQSLGPGEEIVPKKPEGMRGSEIADRATSAAVGASLLKSGLSGLPSASSTIPSAVPSSKVAGPFDHLEGKKLTPGGSVRANSEIEKNKTLWEKIARVMKRAYEKGVSTEMLRKIFKKFGFSVAAKLTGALAGVVAAPFSVGASLLITALGVYMLASDVIDLYDWFIEYEKELDAYEKASSPTPVAADPTSVSPTPTASTAMSTSSPTKPTKTGGMSSSRLFNKTAPTSSGGSDYASRIGGRESGGNYDTIFGKAGGAMINGKSVTENTIAEVGAWQADQKARKTNKQAAGKYQFMDVMSAAKLAGLGPNDLFNGPNQEKMMEAYTASNAKSLRAYGLPDTEEYLSMAHAVGPKGAKQLIDAQNAGMGDANSLDVLGLKGEAAKTNPQLNTNVNATITALKSGRPMGHGTMLAKNKTPLGSGLTQAQNSVLEQQYRLMGGGTTVINNAPTTNTTVAAGGGSNNGGGVKLYNEALRVDALRMVL